MKTIDELIRKVDQRMIKKTGHRLTQDEIDLVRDTHAALGIIERRKTVRAKRPVQQAQHKITPACKWGLDVCPFDVANKRCSTCKCDKVA